METCSIRTKKQMEKNIKLNNGEYAVLRVQNGKLYIDYKGGAIRMINPYDYEPDKVELVEVGGVVYIKDFAPQVKENKTKTTNKRKENKQ